MSITPLYGTVNARTATRALILLQVAVLTVGLWLNFSYEEVLLHEDLLEIKNAYAALSSSRSMYVVGVAFALYVVSLGGLFFMAVWAKWLFTASWLVAMLYPLSDWSQVTIGADVLQVPEAMLDVLGGATLAVIWLNAWSARGMASAAEGVDSPR
jgi:hypothetical protein